MVTGEEIGRAIRGLQLSGRPVCVHSSLRSFGWVDGGAPTVVHALLAEGCTVLVPTFSWDEYAIAPPPHLCFVRNGTDVAIADRPSPGVGRIYTPDSSALDRADMGAVPAAVLAMRERARGNHPLCSFSAVGPLAHELVAGQASLDVFAPLEELARRHGAAILMGVGLNRLTMLHLAERHAGRNLFRRWANGPDGEPIAVEVGGCSEGFPKLEQVLAPVTTVRRVGESTWRALPVNEALHRAAQAMRADPRITHCGEPGCIRCDDAVRGGPVLDQPFRA